MGRSWLLARLRASRMSLAQPMSSSRRSPAMGCHACTSLSTRAGSPLSSAAASFPRRAPAPATATPASTMVSTNAARMLNLIGFTVLPILSAAASLLLVGTHMSAFYLPYGAVPKKRCLELSGAQDSSIYWGWRVPATFFWATLRLLTGDLSLEARLHAP